MAPWCGALHLLIVSLASVMDRTACLFVYVQEEKLLLEQMDKVVEKGSWMVFSDPIDRANYYSSLQDFQEHVRQAHLVRA